MPGSVHIATLKSAGLKGYGMKPKRETERKEKKASATKAGTACAKAQRWERRWLEHRGFGEGREAEEVGSGHQGSCRPRQGFEFCPKRI